MNFCRLLPLPLCVLLVGSNHSNNRAAGSLRVGISGIKGDRNFGNGAISTYVHLGPRGGQGNEESCEDNLELHGCVYC
ncbi:hypothetical protein F4818DRAFT_398680 [Hypoxylon cercidicola]|nr:hypothetical protein F4818DRAFT_398680 [Hypoxylon cercidicola]